MAELLFSVDIQLPSIEVDVLSEAHESAADEDRHVVVAEQDHVAYPVCRVFAAFLGPLHEKIVNFETSVLDLLLSLFCFLSQDGTSLLVAIAILSLEVLLHVFVALMHNTNGVDQCWSFLYGL